MCLQYRSNSDNYPGMSFINYPSYCSIAMRDKLPTRLWLWISHPGDISKTRHSISWRMCNQNSIRYPSPHIEDTVTRATQHSDDINVVTSNQQWESRNRLCGNRSPQNPLNSAANQNVTRRWVSKTPGISRPIRTRACDVTAESTQMRPMKMTNRVKQCCCVTISAEIERAAITWKVWRWTLAKEIFY